MCLNSSRGGIHIGPGHKAGQGIAQKTKNRQGRALLAECLQGLHIGHIPSVSEEIRWVAPHVSFLASAIFYVRPAALFVSSVQSDSAFRTRKRLKRGQ